LDQDIPLNVENQDVGTFFEKNFFAKFSEREYAVSVNLTFCLF